MPPSIITVDVDELSTTMPPSSAPIEMVAWNDDVNSTDAASVPCGKDFTNQVCEQTGTPPYARPHTISSTTAPICDLPSTGSSSVAAASMHAAMLNVRRTSRAAIEPATKLPT